MILHYVLAMHPSVFFRFVYSHSRRWESSISCRTYNTSNCLIYIYCKQKSSRAHFSLKIMDKELFRTSRSFVSLDIEMLNDLNSSGFNLFFGLVLTTPPPHSVKTNMNTQNIIILTRNFVTKCAKSIFKSDSHRGCFFFNCSSRFSVPK